MPCNCIILLLLQHILYNEILYHIMQANSSDLHSTEKAPLFSGAEVPNPLDIELNKPSKSKFLFHLGFLGFFIFIAGCSYGLWNNKYRTTSDVEVPESTTYNPKYK